MNTDVLQLQVWILGGVTSLLLVAIITLLKSNMSDIKSMLEDHEERIRANESFRERAEERAKSSDAVSREVKANLEKLNANMALIINR